MASMEDVIELYSSGKGWMGKLLVTPTKQPKPLFANATLALREAPAWKSVLAYDEFALVTVVMAPPPWCPPGKNWKQRHWTDHDDAHTCEWLHREGIGVSLNVAAQAAEAIARENSFHPIRDYLTSLVWDGKKRVSMFASTYLGAEIGTYHRSVSKCMLVAPVARIMEPGAKCDHMAILEGEQDKGKSSAVEALFDRGSATTLPSSAARTRPCKCVVPGV